MKLSFIQRLIGLVGYQSGPAPQKQRSSHRPAGIRRRPSSSRKRRHRQFPRRQSDQWQVAYHGTSLAAAQAILQRGFLAGPGMAVGSGIYFATDVLTASVYGDHYLKCLVDIQRACQWTTLLQTQFSTWCQQRGARADAAAKSSFLLAIGKRVLIEGKVLVVLRPAVLNPAAAQYRDNRIRILSVHRSCDGVRVRV